ncbi:MAG: ArnT family glycosyltransferase [Promethearchaeota archaeon]
MINLNRSYLGPLTLHEIVRRTISKLSLWIKNDWLIILTLFLTSFIIRFLYILIWDERLNELVISDFRTYNNLAMNILEKGFFGLDNPWSYRPPLYPLLLSGIYAIFDQNFLLARIGQAIIASFSVVFLYFLTKEIFDKKVAFIAGLISCSNFTLIMSTGLFGSEILYIFLSLICFVFLIKGVKYEKSLYFVLSGVFLGLSALCRPTILAFIPFVLIGFLLINRIKRLWFYYLIMVFVSFLVIFPWTIRNYVIHKKFVLISTNGGYVFWIGLHKGATGGYHFPEDQSNPLHKMKDEVAGSKIGYREGINYIRNYPREFIRLMFVKSYYFWNLSPFGMAISVKQHFLYLILSMIGIVLSIRKWNDIIFIYLYIGTIWGVHTIVHSGFRFCVPLIPFLCMFVSRAIISACKYNTLVQAGRRTK